MNTLIVIPSYSGEYLGDLIASLKDCPYPFRIVNTESGGRDTGALIKCYKENPNFTHYFLLHDSMVVKKPNFLDDFQGDVCGWLKFPIDTCGWDRAYLTSIYGEVSDYPYGIFGSVMKISRKALRKLEKEGLLPISANNKSEAQAWERGWALVLNQIGQEINFVDDWNQPKIYADGYEHFKKKFGDR